VIDYSDVVGDSSIFVFITCRWKWWYGYNTETCLCTCFKLLLDYGFYWRCAKMSLPILSDDFSL
jgi:hypothetical protein